MLLQENLDYTFQLPAFEGPLDLLLRLIEREELDITEIALAQVADQYLAHVRAMEQPDPDSLSSFLVLAARLLLIKSRVLLPRALLAKSGAAPKKQVAARMCASHPRSRLRRPAMPSSMSPSPICLAQCNAACNCCCHWSRPRWRCRTQR